MRDVLRGSLVFSLIAAVIFVLGLTSARPAFADAKAKKEIETKMKEAMENYDLLEYEEARKILNQALTIAKKAKMESDPVTAKVHLRLGIVYFAGLQDAESAKLSFLNAAEIDKAIQLDKAYSTPEMSKLLDEAKSEAGGGSGGGGGGGSGGGGAEPDGGGGGETVDCATVEGLQHTIVDTAKDGRDLTLEAAVGADVEPAKVSIMYRSRGATDFSESKMVAAGCVYRGIIPKAALGGDLVHYYVAAYNKQGRVLASKGSAGSPNIIEVAGGGGGSNLALDEENPLGDLNAGGGGGGGGVGGGGGGGGGEIGGGVKVRPSGKKTLFVALAGGSGGGYVTGETEQEPPNDVKCCFAPQLLHAAPEIGYYISSTTAVSLVARIGFPIGANTPGHATAAPAGFLKIRKLLSSSGSGLVVSGGVGGGVIRDTIKLDGVPMEENTGTVAIGPLFVVGGAGYSAALSNNLALVAELNAVAGIPVVSELSGNIINFGVQLDFNLGLHIGF